MDSPGRPYRADWYPDPTGRFEYRYHNGAAWTADVSVGGVRYVDPGADRASPPRPGRRDRLGTAAMVCGIVGICLSWAPVLFVVGAVASVLGLVFGLVAKRRTPSDTRGFAGVGVVTGAGGIVLAGVGVWTTWLVIDAVDRYQNPPPAVATITRCTVDDGGLVVGGSLRNAGSTDGDYRVVVRVREPGRDGHDVAIAVGEVAAGATTEFAERVALPRRRSSTTEPDPPSCAVAAITGPLPLGLDIGLDVG